MLTKVVELAVVVCVNYISVVVAVGRPVPLSGGEYILRDDSHPRIRNQSDEEILVSRLFSEYDELVDPKINGSDLIEVWVGIMIITIQEMDEVNQMLHLQTWLSATWLDERLSWQPEQYSGLKTLTVQTGRLWLVDLVMYNSAAEIDTAFLRKANAVVSHEGLVQVTSQLKLSVDCHMDLTVFPFDDAKCHIKIGSWTYDSESLVCHNSSSRADLSMYIANDNWMIDSTSFFQIHDRHRPVVTDPGPEEALHDFPHRTYLRPFTDVEIIIRLKRKYYSAYIFYIFVPCLTVELISMLSFWLDPRDDEKITMGIGLILAYILFLMAVNEKLPRSGTEIVPLISIYLTLTMALTAIMVGIQIFLLNWYFRPAHLGPVPKWLRILVIGGLGSFVSSCTAQEGRDLDSQLSPIKTDKNDLSPNFNRSRSGSIDSHHRRIHFKQSKSTPERLAAKLAYVEGVKLKKREKHVEDTVNYLTITREESLASHHVRADWFRVAFILDRVIFYLVFFITSIINFITLIWLPLRHYEHASAGHRD